MDVDLATETAIQDTQIPDLKQQFQKQRDAMIQQIEGYEAKAIEAIHIDQKAKEEFQTIISDLDEFSKTWRSYLNKVKIDDEEVKKTNDLAVELKKKGDRYKRQMDSFVFNGKMICFEKNFKTKEMCSLGVIKFKYIIYDLKEFKNVDLSDIVTSIYN